MSQLFDECGTAAMAEKKNRDDQITGFTTEKGNVVLQVFDLYCTYV